MNLSRKGNLKHYTANLNARVDQTKMSDCWYGNKDKICEAISNRS